MTSSNADYAKFILKSIFVDQTGKEIDYWKYFDVCIGDARKPYFFNMENPFFTNKSDYPDTPVKNLKSKTWFSQGKLSNRSNYFGHSFQFSAGVIANTSEALLRFPLH